MHADWQGAGGDVTLRVDGGMVASDWTMQFLADILDAPIDRPTILETTALGAAWLAGMQAGLWPDQEGFAKSWALEQQFKPKMDEQTRSRRYAAWQRAVKSTIGF
jgi:glycerol kinase